MSSAALQTAPHQQHTALASSPLSTPSSRQYKPSHSSPNSQAYNAQQTSTASSSSRRPPSRKTNESAPSHSYHLTPGFGAPATASAPNDQDQGASDWQGNMPPVAPPRSSSNHQSGSSRRSQYSNEKSPNSPRRNDSTRTGSRGESAAAENGYRSSKADAAARASSRDGSKVPSSSLPVRSAHSTPSKPVHDATDSLTKAIAAAQDTIDRDRNHAGHQQNGDNSAMPPPAVATGEHGEERRQRSRHDHSKSHKGNTKFGDFILGNTIGEGEFGKVKLGWKQDSSVQVSFCTYP